MPERLIKQFNKLQKTEPSMEWAENTRNFLVAKVTQDTLGKESSWAFTLRLNSMAWVKRIAPSPTKVVSFLIIIGLIGGTNMVAQAEYIPKRPLYTVKRTFEKIELVMALTPESETKVNLKHATKRKDEAVKIAQKEDIAPEEKTENINTVVKSMEQNISAANNTLQIASESDKNSESTAKLAKEINKNVSANIKDLDKVKEISSEAVGEVVDEALDELEKAEDTSIKVLIDQVQQTNEEGQSDSSEVVSKEEVKEILNVKIQRTDEKLQKIGEKVKVVGPEQQIGGPIVDKSDVNQVKENSEAAQVILEEVKVLVNDNMLSEALEKFQETSKITKESEKTISKIEKVANEVIKETASTSTDKGGVKGIIELEGEDSSEVIDLKIEDILNYAPLGGEIIQSATQTPEVGTSSLNYLYSTKAKDLLKEFEE